MKPQRKLRNLLFAVLMVQYILVAILIVMGMLHMDIVINGPGVPMISASAPVCESGVFLPRVI